MSLPFVSVIVPSYNDAERLSACLACLGRQRYPSDRFEVLAVDNGSELSPAPIVEALPNGRCLYEATPGSYAARNCGLAEAKGEILAFTDSDCLPESEWIAEGVAAVKGLGGPGLIAGRIDVFFADPERPSWVELYEREFAFLQKENVEVRHYGATANVFAPRSTFDAVGTFDGSLKSGGDREWGNRVFAAGLPVQYSDAARVGHPARRTVAEYFEKLRRTAHGHFANRHQPGTENLFTVPKILRSFIPPRSVLARIGQSGAPLSALERAKVAGFVFASRYYTNLYRLKLTLKPPRGDAPR